MKTKEPSLVSLQCQIPCDAYTSISDRSSKCALASTCQAHSRTAYGMVYSPGTRVTGGPGLNNRATQSRVRVRPPDFGGYPFVAGNPRVAPKLGIHQATAARAAFPAAVSLGIHRETAKSQVVDHHTGVTRAHVFTRKLNLAEPSSTGADKIGTLPRTASLLSRLAVWGLSGQVVGRPKMAARLSWKGEETPRFSNDTAIPDIKIYTWYIPVDVCHDQSCLVRPYFIL